MVQVQIVGQVGSNHELTHFCFGSKNSGSVRVFFESDQKVLTHFAMSSYESRILGHQ